MAETPRRIVVTDAQTPLGRGLLTALRASPEVELVCGVQAKPGNPDFDRDLDPELEIDTLPIVPDPRPFAEYLEKQHIDTVLQCGLAPDRSGASARAVEADVIATMCLGAAIAHERSPVRNWVLASSSAIYPIGSHSPLMQIETQERPREEETIAASIAEAEDYARDVAIRLPHVNVAILRLQHLVGPGIRGPLARLLGHDPVPVLIGFDPTIQLLHLEDAVAALAHAARNELAGVYNVASAGLIHWQDAVRATGHERIPVLPLSITLFEPLLERVGIPFAPAELFDLMRFGHVVDIRKLERTGWKPSRDQHACLSRLTRSEAEAG